MGAGNNAAAATSKGGANPTGAASHRYAPAVSAVTGLLAVAGIACLL